jgi:hypothetical protein
VWLRKHGQKPATNVDKKAIDQRVKLTISDGYNHIKLVYIASKVALFGSEFFNIKIKLRN